MLVNAGNDIVSRQLGGDTLGQAGTATSTGTTSLANTGAPFTGSAYIGHVVWAGAVYGVTQSNTTSTLTIDRWYNPASPGGSAGSTPSGTTTYIVGGGGAPALFIGITSTNITPGSGDTSLSGEITTSGGGLIRKIGVYGHSAGAASYTQTPVFTANGSDSLPVTVYAGGNFTSMVVAATASTMMLETSMTVSATLSASGDGLALTWTISL